MEHIIFHHIMSHFTSQNLLNPLQHGFRPNHSCQTQLIDFIDEVQQSAFDTVPHRRLINKLEFYGVRGPLLHWISAWLLKRQQRVTVDGETSGATPVKSGVPQGTVLGPLMFLVYINDINEGVKSSVRLFADDCVIYKLIKTPQHAEQLQSDLHKIIEWTKTWQMKVNVEKCAVLRCTRSLSPILNDYTLASHNIAIKRLHTYLGIGIDSNLTWSSHTSNK